MGKRFRLERLLRLKERVEDEAKAELGRVQSQLGQAEVALGQLRGLPMVIRRMDGLTSPWFT